MCLSVRELLLSPLFVQAFTIQFSEWMRLLEIVFPIRQTIPKTYRNRTRTVKVLLVSRSLLKFKIYMSEHDERIHLLFQRK